MPNNVQLLCCNTKIEVGDLWFLADIKGFTARKIYIGTCKKCKEDVVVLLETRIDDKKVFINQFKGIEAIKTIYREKKRKVAAFPNIKTNCLYGWVYGVNVEIKNKKGKTTQIRQYASDFKGKKALVKSFSSN